MRVVPKYQRRKKEKEKKGRLILETFLVATLLGQQPHTFRGLQTIGTIFFILDLVLFVIFTCLIVARFCMHPGSLRLSLHHPHEVCNSLPCPLTILQFMQ